MDYNDLNSYKDIVDRKLLKVYNNGPLLLKEPINHIVSGGKRLRPILCIMTNEVCGGYLDNVLSPAIAVELLHIFSLIHDDIMDGDKIRHNKKTIHYKWNVPIGILAGDAILALALRELNMSSDLIRKKFNNALIAVCEGQALDLEYESLEKINLDHYLEMINLKTGCMIGLSAELGAMVAGVDEETSLLFNNFGLLMGKAFQIQDDLLEITSTSEKMGKSLNSDIALNKKTYLLLRAKNEYPDEIKEIYLKNKSNNIQLNNDIKNFLVDYSIVEDTINFIDSIFDEIDECLNKLNLKKSKLDAFVNFIRNRKL